MGHLLVTLDQVFLHSLGLLFNLLDKRLLFVNDALEILEELLELNHRLLKLGDFIVAPPHSIELALGLSGAVATLEL